MKHHLTWLLDDAEMAARPDFSDAEVRLVSVLKTSESFMTTVDIMKFTGWPATKVERVGRALADKGIVAMGYE